MSHAETVLFCRKMGTTGLLEVLTFLIMKRQRMVTQRYPRFKDDHCVGLDHPFHETVRLLATLSISVLRLQSVVLYLNLEQNPEKVFSCMLQALRRLAQNREAARKSRLRKKVWGS